MHKDGWSMLTVYNPDRNYFNLAIELKKSGRIPVVAYLEEFDVRVRGSGITYNEGNRDANITTSTQIQIAEVKRFDYD